MTTNEESPGSMAEGRASASFADRLNYLFATVHPADRKPYSNQEVAATITATGESISQQYLWLLRTGKRDNPTKRHLEAIAAFFGVPGAYFLDEAAANDLTEQLELLKAARDAQVRETMMRASRLSPTDRVSMLRILRSLERDPIDNDQDIEPGGNSGDETS